MKAQQNFIVFHLFWITLLVFHSLCAGEQTVTTWVNGNNGGKGVSDTPAILAAGRSCTGGLMGNDGDGGDDLVVRVSVINKFPWPLFMPAITKMGKCSPQNLLLCTTEETCLQSRGYWYTNSCHAEITCSDIAGYYSGDMSDNCPGFWVSGPVFVSITSGCYFHADSYMYGVSSFGIFNHRQGDVITSDSAQTSVNGCGQFSITCTDRGDSHFCNYRYLNGRMGTMTIYH